MLEIKPKRDFIFIEDVIDAYFRLVEKRRNLLPGDIFNIGSGEQYSVKEVFEIISELTGYMKIPNWGKVKERESDVAKVWQADITKAKEVLEWSPTFTLREGLKKTIQWFTNNLHLYKGE